MYIEYIYSALLPEFDSNCCDQLLMALFPRPSPPLPSSKASQDLLLLLLLMLMKEPFPGGVHAWSPHSWPHGYAPTAIGGPRQLPRH